MCLDRRLFQNQHHATPQNARTPHEPTIGESARWSIFYISLALLFGVVSLTLITLQGATFLSHRTDGDLQARVKKTASLLAIVLMVAFSLGGFWVSRIDGYVIQSIGDVGGVLSPLMKEVGRAPGAWFANYDKMPILWLIPALAYVGGVVVLLALRAGYSAATVGILLALGRRFGMGTLHTGHYILICRGHLGG